MKFALIVFGVFLQEYTVLGLRALKDQPVETMHPRFRCQSTKQI